MEADSGAVSVALTIQLPLPTNVKLCWSEFPASVSIRKTPPQVQIYGFVIIDIRFKTNNIIIFTITSTPG